MVYREVQPMYRAGWIWFVFIPLIATVVLVFTLPGVSPAVILISIILPLFFIWGRLITEVRDDGIYIKYLPLHIRYHQIPFDDIESFECRTYKPLMDYGGWGIKWGIKGKAYNVYGNRGLQLYFKNGKRLLIGSQNPEALVKAMEQTYYFRSKNKNKS